METKNMKKGKFHFKEHDDKSIRISYQDLDVDYLGGSDYEALYDINAENRAKLQEVLEKTNTGELEDMIRNEFGEYLDKKSFAQYCESNGIKYELFTWID